jgi:uncharacterized protein (TIGR04255 family)
MNLVSPSGKHYPKAPITEAVIGFLVDLPPDVSASALEQTHRGEETRYPIVEPLMSNVGQMVFGPQASASASSTPTGFLFRSADKKQIYQSRLDGFTMSRLAPYGRWEEFCSEGRRLWDIYRSVAQPSKVVRAAVRYINRINIPLPMNDFGDYLRTVPQVAADLPQELSGYFMQLMLPLADIKGYALINETIVEPASPNVVSIVLDIDIFRTDDLPSTENELWALLEKFRHVKNNVFERCITDKARGLFR